MHIKCRRYGSFPSILIWAHAAALLAFLSTPAAAQSQEPSPIAIELVAPAEVMPGQEVEIQLWYSTADLNAGADINYNVYGPCHITDRSPLPPNPLVNTWIPKPTNAEGTIRIRIKVDLDTDGQFIQHEVQVRWGSKSHSYSAISQIKFVPPTATPTLTPVPQPTTMLPTVSPTPLATASPRPTFGLVEVQLAGQEGGALAEIQANAQVALDIVYTSTVALNTIQVTIRFEPDVVNLEGLKRLEDRYVIELETLDAAPEGAALLGDRILGRIRPFPEAGRSYELQAIVQVQTAEDATHDWPRVLPSNSVSVIQDLSVTVEADVIDGAVFRAGGSVILHATCINQGLVAVHGLRLRLDGLPAGFTVLPREQTVDAIAAQGGAERRPFTIATPENYEGLVGFKLVAILDDVVIESKPSTIVMSAPVPLDISVSTSQALVYAGESLHLTVVYANKGLLPSYSVVAKLIDSTGHLGTVVQDVGDLPAGALQETSFILPVPEDFALDTVASLVVQTISGDGTESRSVPLTVGVICIPTIELTIRPPIGQLQGGATTDVAVNLHNTSQCTARDVIVSVVDLPASFTVPPEQQVVELGPGRVRELVFNILVPHGFSGSGLVAIQAVDAGGNRVRSESAALDVGGPSLVFTIVFGLLVVLAVSAIVVGVLLYLRHR